MNIAQIQIILEDESRNPDALDSILCFLAPGQDGPETPRTGCGGLATRLPAGGREPRRPAQDHVSPDSLEAA